MTIALMPVAIARHRRATLRRHDANTDEYWISSCCPWTRSLPVAFCGQLHLGFYRQCGFKLHRESTACSTSAGNSINFTASPAGGPTIKATAWYLNGTTSSATFQKATLGQYSSGLGVCYPGENCTNPDHQVDNNAFDEYVLFEFSAPVDPSTVHIRRHPAVIWTRRTGSVATRARAMNLPVSLLRRWQASVSAQSTTTWERPPAAGTSV